MTKKVHLPKLLQLNCASLPKLTVCKDAKLCAANPKHGGPQSTVVTLPAAMWQTWNKLEMRQKELHFHPQAMCYIVVMPLLLYGNRIWLILTVVPKTVL